MRIVAADLSVCVAGRSALLDFLEFPGGYLVVSCLDRPRFLRCLCCLGCPPTSRRAWWFFLCASRWCPAARCGLWPGRIVRKCFGSLAGWPACLPVGCYSGPRHDRSCFLLSTVAFLYMLFFHSLRAVRCASADGGTSRTLTVCTIALIPVHDSLKKRKRRRQPIVSCIFGAVKCLRVCFACDFVEVELIRYG